MGLLTAVFIKPLWGMCIKSPYLLAFHKCYYLTAIPAQADKYSVSPLWHTLTMLPRKIGYVLNVWRLMWQDYELNLLYLKLKCNPYYLYKTLPCLLQSETNTQQGGASTCRLYIYILAISTWLFSILFWHISEHFSSQLSSSLFYRKKFMTDTSVHFDK